jgi:uncharacterized membrane protein (DUF373 family)
MIRIAYVSIASKPFSETELLELLANCRSNNTRNGISGQLIYHEGTFTQILEGPDAVVDATFQRIKKDTRHRNVTLIERSSIDQPQFPDWSMGFKSMSREELKGIEGYNYYLEGDIKEDAGPHASQIFIDELMRHVKKQYVAEISGDVLSTRNEERSLMSLLNNLVRYAIMALAVLMAVVVFGGVIEVGMVIYRTAMESPGMLLSVNGITATFASFLAVLIAIDIFINISLYVRRHVIAVRLVVATALMAVARKIIVLEFTDIEPIQFFAMATIVIALGFSYYFLSKLKRDQVIGDE